MRRIAAIGCILAVLWPAWASLSAEAAWQINDMEQTGPATFAVTGADPFLISSEIGRPLRDIYGLYWSLHVNNAPPRYPMQLFLETDQQPYNESFSYRFTPDSDGGIFIPFHLYEAGSAVSENAVLKTVRLDIDQCSGCTLSIRDFRVIEQEPDEMLELVPQLLITPVLPRKPAADISDKGPWRLNHITDEGGGNLRIDGKDPFIQSPVLDVPTDRAQGVHFKIRFPSGSGMQILQFFWESYNFGGYDERRSLWVWMEIEQETADFYIPFTSLPPGDLLKILRMDFYVPQGAAIRIQSARIVASADAELLLRTPHIFYAGGIWGVELVQVLRNIIDVPGNIAERSNVGRMKYIFNTTGIAHRLAGDKIFMIIYMCVVLSVSGVAVWMWSKL